MKRYLKEDFWRGVQSALFYYVSCTPWADYVYRRKRRKEAKRAEKHKNMGMDQPEVPQSSTHVPPFTTNPYWREEIMMGPGPPARRAKKNADSARRNISTRGTQSTVTSNTASSVELGRMDTKSNKSRRSSEGSRWNWRKWQREDEELWGTPRSSNGPNLNVDGSSLGFPGITRPGTNSSAETYYVSCRRTAVNDLHPPTVTEYSRREETSWMLQPPPSAKIMNGKEKPGTRSRSDSGNSKATGSEASLARQAGIRALQDRARRREVMGGDMQRRRGNTNTTASTSASSSSAYVTASRLRVDGSEDTFHSADTIIRKPEAAATPELQPMEDHVVTFRPSRQKLTTIMSSGNISPVSNYGSSYPNLDSPGRYSSQRPPDLERSDSTDSGHDRMAKRPPLVVTDGSLNALENFVHVADLHRTGLSTPIEEAKICLPHTSGDDLELGIPELDGLGALEDDVFRFGYHDRGLHPPRSLSMRWSVDF